MAVFRESPYSAFNFLVELENGEGREVHAGFSEVSGLNSELTVAEYRAGNANTNYVTKVPGIYKSGDVTLKRGVIGHEALWKWMDQARKGDLAAKRDVVIKLLDETRSETVTAWTLRGTMPLKWTGPTLTAKGGGDVAIEELVLATEAIDQE
jgi:phage tail-like protein